MQTEFRTTDPADARYIEVIKECAGQAGLGDFTFHTQPIISTNGRQTGTMYILGLTDADFVHFTAGLDAGPDCD